MTDDTGRAALAKQELYGAAHEFERLLPHFEVPSAPASPPTPSAAARRLSSLTELIGNISDEVLFLDTDSDPGLDLGPVMWAYTEALVPAGRAVEHHTEAFNQIGFLRRYAEYPDNANLRDGRRASFDVVQERLELVQLNLKEAADSLRGSADRLDGTPPRTLAALSRSARPRNSIYRVPAASAPAPASPLRLAYLPEPRRGR
ncbi:hypothetical protein ABII15_36090 [Streptomyces sp. HUAS MG91]|uniref:Uncharacterized protein n=1 Tax=Streptomyces tabacisoli TaxID=3156398 RepID=A0AAU8J4A8_9ACTN